ncbi:hypothetical protein BDW59DRAFT_159261 [Aspergillus cavernicola]|uniref:Uncharacterized protein n=1 Tax=Aspergillus cavernicola TaxID=176166 RepID=A0ABR4INL2_9EURO
MSDKESPRTLPSGTTATRFSGSSKGGDSSGQTSTTSQIDTHDPYRIGGPGKLPAWPVSFLPAQDIDQTLAEAVFDIAIDHLTTSNLDYKSIFFGTRATEGHPISASDTTLLIQASFDSQHDRLVAFLDNLLQVLFGFGYNGRVEIIDPRATQGTKTFPPIVSKQQQEGWEEILTNIIETLARSGADWRQVFAANRGYWKEVSKITVVIKATNITKEHPQIRQLRDELEDNHFQLEIAGTRRLWGLFGSLTGTVGDEQVRDSIGWSVSPAYHGMGLSVGRTFQGISSTLGGYLKTQCDDVEHIIGLTCYHGVRLNEHGTADPNIDSQGATDLSWPCQSPSPEDLEIVLEPLQSKASGLIPPNLAPPIKARRESERQESVRKLQEVQDFNPFIGNVVAVSGWRNPQIGNGLNAPLVFVDWACIDISQQHCPYPINAIDHVKQRLLEKMPEGVPHWTSTKTTVDQIADIPWDKTPCGEIAIFKEGRTTGITVGALGDLVPAAHRVAGLPAHLHHRAWVVYSSPFRKSFSQPGDSGAWCLNGDGDVVGQLVGGDEADGSGLLIPFSTVVEDIEVKFGLKSGTVCLP